MTAIKPHLYGSKKEYKQWGKEDALHGSPMWSPMLNPEHKHAHIYIKQYKETMMLMLLKQNHE